MTLENLTPEQKASLLLELKAEQAAKAAAVAETRRLYKEMVNDVIPELFEELSKASVYLSSVKTKVYEGVHALLELKKEAYNTEKHDLQNSHTFTTDSGKTITVGFIVTDGWDDTVSEGLARINSYLDAQAVNESTSNLVKFIKDLLSKDAKGNLNSRKIITLKKRTDQIADKELSEGVDIIMQAFRPTRSREYIRCSHRNELGENVFLPLSITEADIIN